MGLLTTLSRLCPWKCYMKTKISIPTLKHSMTGEGKDTSQEKDIYILCT